MFETQDRTRNSTVNMEAALEIQLLYMHFADFTFHLQSWYSCKKRY